MKELKRQHRPVRIESVVDVDALERIQQQLQTKESICSACGNTTEIMHEASQWLNVRKQNRYYYTLCDDCCGCYGSGNCELKPAEYRKG